MLSLNSNIYFFRHAHGFNFGSSDIYVIALLRPLSRSIRRCEREISQCRWMPLQEFLQHEQVHDTNKHFARAFLEGRRMGVTVARTEIELRFKEFRRMQQVYSIKKREEQEQDGSKM